MSPIKLTSDDGKHTLWKCGICGRYYQDEAFTETCCKCKECGEVVEYKGAYRSSHDDCDSNRMERRNAESLANAVEVQYEGGFIYSDDVSGYRDGYFQDMDDLCEYCECEDVAPPEFVFACLPSKHEMDLDTILEHLCSDGYEEMAEQMDIPPELMQGIKLFNEQNARSLVSYYQDHKRKYRVTPQ